MIEQEFLELYDTFTKKMAEDYGISHVLISMRDTNSGLTDVRVKPRVIGPNHAAASIATLTDVYLKIAAENDDTTSEFVVDLTKILAYVESLIQGKTKQ